MLNNQTKIGMKNLKALYLYGLVNLAFLCHDILLLNLLVHFYMNQLSIPVWLVICCFFILRKDLLIC